MSFSEQIFAVTAVFLLRQIHKGLSKSSLNYPLGSKQLPNSYLPNKSLGQGWNFSLWYVRVLENPYSRAMRSVLGIPKDREEPELCSPTHPDPELFQEGFPKQEVSVGIVVCPGVWGLVCGAPGEGRGSGAPGAAPGRAPLTAPAQPPDPLGEQFQLLWQLQGAGLVLWPCFPCFNSTWEFNSPGQCIHPWGSLSPSPGTRLLALPWHSTSQTLLPGPGMTFQAQFLTFVCGPPFKLF